MVIKTAFKRKRPKFASKRPFGTVYDLAKHFAKSYGYYEDIKQYDPGYYFERYKYKTAKRVRSKIAQTFQKRFKTYNQYRKTRSQRHYSSYDNKCRKNNSKSSYCSQ